MPARTRTPSRLIASALAALTLACAPASPPPALPFAGLVDSLSEPGGYFDTDNLVSNETAYLHVMGALRDRGIHGGAYLGVGPEQNFSYIAELQPELAILIDIRRDNQLLHLLFKALFEAAEHRLDYLAMLFGRPAPPDPGAWTGRPLAALLDYIDQTPFDSVRHAATHRALQQRIAGFGVPLTADDRATIGRFHDEFARAGLDLRFTTFGRPPQRDYPTVRRLYLETDLDSSRVSYLATEERWRRVRTLQQAGRVVPVVGDLAGEGAMPAIARYLREQELEVSAFYISNVDFYLIRSGTFPAFVRNVRALPAAPDAVLIRSWFDRGFGPSARMPGHFSTQQLQPVERFLELAARPEGVSYLTLVTDTVGTGVGTPR